MKQHGSQPAYPVSPLKRRRGGFTLIELLVSISIIALLLGLLLPALGSARETGRGAVCLSNVRQLVLANSAYAQDNNGYYVPASPDVFSANLMRWHGVRESATSGTQDQRTFEPGRGPLAVYFGHNGQVRFCPTFEGLIDHDAPRFEAGAGGYGYNQSFLGGRRDRFGTNEKSALHTACTDEITTPTETVMFTDAAFNKIVDGAAKLIDYSFAETPWVVQFPGVEPTMHSAPSIHFRHAGSTHAAWADGHVGGETMDFTHPQFEDFYRDLGFGWFGPESNDLFDLE
jgi:prepilin-type N-terminal cleavage/methylation domain-containing protein/prepilin-type processing-associated H-X9-DG protein